MNLGPAIWTDDNKLRQTFSWLTRIGVAPKAGSLPVAYYQQDQCKAIELLESILTRKGLDSAASLRCKQGGVIQAQNSFGSPWVTIAMVVCGQIVAR